MWYIYIIKWPTIVSACDDDNNLERILFILFRTLLVSSTDYPTRHNPSPLLHDTVCPCLNTSVHNIIYKTYTCNTRRRITLNSDLLLLLFYYKHSSVTGARLSILCTRYVYIIYIYDMI